MCQVIEKIVTAMIYVLSGTLKPAIGVLAVLGYPGKKGCQTVVACCILSGWLIGIHRSGDERQPLDFWGDQFTSNMTVSQKIFLEEFFFT